MSSNVRSRLGDQKLYKPPRDREQRDSHNRSYDNDRPNTRNGSSSRGGYRPKSDRGRSSYNDNLRSVQKSRTDTGKYYPSNRGTRGTTRGRGGGHFKRTDFGFSKSPFVNRGRGRGNTRGRGVFNRQIRRTVQNIDDIDEKTIKAFCSKIVSQNAQTGEFDTLDLSSAKSHEFWAEKN